jgi:hypothetical protein
MRRMRRRDDFGGVAIATAAVQNVVRRRWVADPTEQSNKHKSQAVEMFLYTSRFAHHQTAPFPFVVTYALEGCFGAQDSSKTVLGTPSAPA